MSARWLERSVLVTAGTGGVGKTTLAAAIGLEAAARGRRTLVLTIDPARRLAQALGVRSLDHEPQQVPADRIGAAGSPRGALFAMMLDTKRTFDEIVERFTPDPELRRRIFANRIYRQLTDALSGSREYSALEKLAAIHASGEYDLIVLDTPPAAHALDFLDAPRRVLGFLDGGFLEVLLAPSRTGLRLFRLGSELTLRGLERLTGLSFLGDLSEFFGAFEALLGGFRERAELTSKLLRSRACGFVLVAGPDPEQVRRAVAFSLRLQQERVHLAGLVVNRMRTWPSGRPPDMGAEARKEAQRWLEPALGAERAARLLSVARRHAAAARRDAEHAEHIEKSVALERGEMHRIPLLAEDIHTPRGLRRLRAHLFRPPRAAR
jgi:anion-transporting  ArsA/GET3 family ATPase